MLCPRCKKPLRTVDTRTTTDWATDIPPDSDPPVKSTATLTMVERRRRCDLCGINVFTEEKIVRWKKIKPLKRAKELKRRVWPPKEKEDGNK